jgi:hypothetical protein
MCSGASQELIVSHPDIFTVALDIPGGPRFCRVEPRRRARAFVLGLLAEPPRENCWTIAGHAGDAAPRGMQHLLSRACWDADGVRTEFATSRNWPCA